MEPNDPFYKVLSLPETATNLSALDTHKAGLAAKLLLQAEELSEAAIETALTNKNRLPKVHTMVIIGFQMHLAINSQKNPLAKIKANELVQYLSQEDKNNIQEWYNARG